MKAKENLEFIYGPNGDTFVLKQNELENSLVEKLTGMSTIRDYDSSIKFWIEGTDMGGALKTGTYENLVKFIRANANDPEVIANTFSFKLFNEATASSIDGYDSGFAAGKKIVKKKIIFGALAAIAGYGAYRFFKSDDGKKTIQKVKDKIYGETEIEEIPIPEEPVIEEASVEPEVIDIVSEETQTDEQ